MQPDRPQSGRRANRQGRGRPQQNGGDVSQPNQAPSFQAPTPWNPNYGPRDVHPAIAAQQAAGFYGATYAPSPYPPHAMMFQYPAPRPDQTQAMMLSYAYPPQFQPNGYPPMPMAFHPQALPPGWQQWPQVGQPFPPQLHPQFQRPARPQSRQPSGGRGGGRAGVGSRKTPARGPPSSPGSTGSASTQVADQLSGLALGQRRRVGSHPSLSGSAYSADLDSPEPPMPPAVARSPSKAQPPPPPNPNARPLFALDVECVATGPRCQDRTAAEIAVVDEQGSVVLHLHVRPEQPIMSYITDLTGLTRETLEQHGVPFEVARRTFRRAIPKEALLIGYNVDCDLGWLRLTDPDQADPERKEDRDVRDVMGLFKKDPETGRYSRKPVSQDHLVRVLLGEEVGDGHDAVGDAIKSMRLYHLFSELEKDKAKHLEALAKVDSTPREPSFSMKHETYEGVCMGGRSCKCDYSDKPWVGKKQGAVVYNSAAPKPAETTTPAAQNGNANSAISSKDMTPEGGPTANGTTPPNPTATNTLE